MAEVSFSVSVEDFLFKSEVILIQNIIGCQFPIETRSLCIK